MRLFVLFTILVTAMSLGIMASPVPAFAQAASDGYAVQVPWGQWVADILGFVATLIAALIAFALRHLPGNANKIIVQLRVDKLLERALTYGINATSNAVKGKTLDLHTGNQVVQMAIEYAVKHAPQLANEIGLARLKEKILARIDLDDVAEIAAPAEVIDK